MLRERKEEKTQFPMLNGEKKRPGERGEGFFSSKNLGSRPIQAHRVSDGHYQFVEKLLLGSQGSNAAPTTCRAANNRKFA